MNSVDKQRRETDRPLPPSRPPLFLPKTKQVFLFKHSPSSIRKMPSLPHATFTEMPLKQVEKYKKTLLKY